MLRLFTRHSTRWLGALELPHPNQTQVPFRVFSSEHSNSAIQEGKLRTFHSNSEENNTSDLVRDQISDDVKSEEIVQIKSDFVDSHETEEMDQLKFEKVAPVDFSAVEDHHKPSFCPKRGWRLIVQGLPSSNLMDTKTTLENRFQSFGEFNNLWLICDPNDKYTCLGHAYIYMYKYEDACAAVNSLSDSMIDGTPLKALFIRDRKRNLMIYKLPEEEDEDLTKKVGSFLGVVKEDSSLAGTAHRLGKSNDTGMRRVLVTLESDDAVVRILKNRKLLRRSKEFSGVAIGKDMSIQEREKYRDLIGKLMLAKKENPDMVHFISNDAVVSMAKGDKNE